MGPGGCWGWYPEAPAAEEGKGLSLRVLDLGCPGHLLPHLP